MVAAHKPVQKTWKKDIHQWKPNYRYIVILMALFKFSCNPVSSNSWKFASRSKQLDALYVKVLLNKNVKISKHIILQSVST